MLRIILYVVVILVVAGFGAKWYLQTSLDKKLAALTMTDVDLSKVPDGTYTGAYEAFPVSVEAAVTVKDHRITEVKLLKHRNGQGAGAEAIPGKVVASQTLKVDVVSGATISSKVILKAIEIALKSALR